MALPRDVWGWVLRGTREPLVLKSIASHQVLTVVHDYGCRIGGSLELYVPEPPMPEDDALHAMLEVFQVTGVIAGGPFIVDADRVHDRVRTLQPRLFRHAPVLFRIFRIREERLQDLIETLDRR